MELYFLKPSTYRIFTKRTREHTRRIFGMQGIFGRNPGTELRNYAESADLRRKALLMNANLTDAAWELWSVAKSLMYVITPLIEQMGTGPIRSVTQQIYAKTFPPKLLAVL